MGRCAMDARSRGKGASGGTRSGPPPVATATSIRRCARSEAGPSKKRKVAAKGKGKEKEKSESESGLGVDAGALLEEMRKMREEMEGLRAEFRSLTDIGKAVVRLLKMTNRNVEFIVDQMDSGSDVEEWRVESEEKRPSG